MHDITAEPNVGIINADAVPQIICALLSGHSSLACENQCDDETGES